MSHIRHILRALAGREGYSVWNTLWLNYRLFPRSVARCLPLKVGRHVDVRGVGRGSIVFSEGVVPHKFMFRLGVTPWPLYSNRSMHTYLWFHAGAKMVVGDEVDINSGVRIVVTAGATLTLGHRFFVNQNSLLYCSRAITFGDRCTLGWDCQVCDSDFHLVCHTAEGMVSNPTSPIVVGSDVWLANRVSVSKGCKLASHVIVASNSLVCHSLDVPSALYAGIPAELKRTDVAYITDRKLESRLRRRFTREPCATVALTADEMRLTTGDGLTDIQ